MKPIAAFLRFTKRFLAHEQGSILLLFGLMVIFLVGIGGAAVDLGRQQLMTLRIQNAADAGAVSAAAITDNGQAVTDDAQKVVGRRYFNLNYPLNSPNETRPVVSVNRVNDKIVIETNDGDPATITKTNFVSNFGIKTLASKGLSATKANAAATSDYDIVMVVDETGSTSQAVGNGDGTQRIVAMRKALNEMVDSIVPAGTTNKNVRMGVMGYASHLTSKWGLTSNNADLHGFVNKLRPTCNNYDHYGMLSALDMLRGGSGAAEGTFDGNVTINYGGRNYTGPCRVDGDTRAPKPRTTRSADQPGDANGISTVKNVIFLTDGEIMTDAPPCQDVWANRGGPNCYGGGESNRDFNSFLNACRTVRNSLGSESVHVFVVLFATPASLSESVLKQCASTNPKTGKPDYYFAATTGDLITYLKNITEQVKSVRIVQ